MKGRLSSTSFDEDASDNSAPPSPFSNLLICTYSWTRNLATKKIGEQIILADFGGFLAIGDFFGRQYYLYNCTVKAILSGVKMHLAAGGVVDTAEHNLPCAWVFDGGDGARAGALVWADARADAEGPGRVRDCGLRQRDFRVRKPVQQDGLVQRPFAGCVRLRVDHALQRRGLQQQRGTDNHCTGDDWAECGAECRGRGGD